MKYHVFMESRIDDLIRVVNEAITSGWKPLGGVGNISDHAKFYFTQAMLWEG